MCQTFATMPDSAAYAAVIGQEHRRRFGQFFTDPRVAGFMLEWVFACSEKHGTSSVLRKKPPALYDPSFGLGAFRPADKRIQFTASEIDDRVIDFYRTNVDPDLDFIRREDYLTTW